MLKGLTGSFLNLGPFLDPRDSTASERKIPKGTLIWSATLIHRLRVWLRVHARRVGYTARHPPSRVGLAVSARVQVQRVGGFRV